MSDLAICLATYNPDLSFFKKQIHSIISQTYENWQCLISDQSSDQSTRQVIKDLVAQDSRFIYLDNSKNQNGLIYNFENALKSVASSVNYICFCDQDDVWHPNKLKDLVQILKDHSEVGLVHSDLRLIDSHDQLLANSCWQYEQRNLSQVNDFTELLMRNQITGCSMIFRKQVLEFCLPFPNSLNKFLLHDHWVSLCCLASGFKIYNFNNPLIDYRQHENNQIGAAKKGSRFSSLKNLQAKGFSMLKIRLEIYGEILKRSEIQKSNVNLEIKFFNSKSYYAKRLFTKSRNLQDFKLNFLIALGSLSLH